MVTVLWRELDRRIADAVEESVAVDVAPNIACDSVGVSEEIKDFLGFKLIQDTRRMIRVIHIAATHALFRRIDEFLQQSHLRFCLPLVESADSSGFSVSIFTRWLALLLEKPAIVVKTFLIRLVLLLTYALPFIALTLAFIKKPRNLQVNRAVSNELLQQLGISLLFRDRLQLNYIQNELLHAHFVLAQSLFHSALLLFALLLKMKKSDFSFLAFLNLGEV